MSEFQRSELHAIVNRQKPKGRTDFGNLGAILKQFIQGTEDKLKGDVSFGERSRLTAILLALIALAALVGCNLMIREEEW